MKHVCVLLNGPIKNDGRVIRTIKSLSKIFDVDLFYLNGEITDSVLFNENVTLFSSNEKVSFKRKFLKHSFFSHELTYLSKKVLKGKKNYDYIWANDLPCLLPAFIISKKQPFSKVIYDSHEIYTETINQFFAETKNPFKNLVFGLLKKIMRISGTHTEKKYISKCKRVITVNESLSDYFKMKYNIPSPNVILNCPEIIDKKPEPIDLRKLFGWDKSDVIFLYQGLLNEGRGLKKLVNCWVGLPKNIKLAIIGNGILKNELMKIVDILSINENVKFHTQIDHKILINYTAATDYGINLLEPYNLSKKLALPNKLFEYIHSGIPSISSDTIEIRKIFNNYQIGILTDNTLDDIKNKILTLSKANRDDFVLDCNRAKQKYNWAQEEPKIFTILEQC